MTTLHNLTHKTYHYVLGKHLRKQLQTERIQQNRIGADDEANLSDSTVSEILSGKRALSSKSLDAFADTIGDRTYDSILFPDEAFAYKLLQELLTALLEDTTVQQQQPNLYQILAETVEVSKSKDIETAVEQFMTKQGKAYAKDFYYFIPDFPVDNNSKEMVPYIIEWLISFVLSLS